MWSLWSRIGLHKTALHALEMREKVLYALRIYLHQLQINVFSFQQVLRKYTHSRANFQDRYGHMFANLWPPSAG